MAEPVTDPGRVSGRTRLGGVASAALLIAAVTVAARVVGFGRLLVFSKTVGDGCLGSVYTTANAVPNVVFEVVAGGALAGAVVPLLAAPLARGERAEAGRVASALLTWVLTLLVPVTLLGLLVARPAIDVLLSAQLLDACPAAAATGTRMLQLFLPQVPFYGLAVVLAGLLQAGRRFLAPALAPLLSSVVVATTYLVFAFAVPSTPAAPAGDARSGLPPGTTLLAVGTTVGVLVLALAMVPAAARVGLRLRPTWRFPPGAARRAGSLAAAGAAGLVAQQLATLVVTRLANAQGGEGAVVRYGYAWTVYLLPYAVLAIPIATSAFPTLAADRRDGVFPARVAESSRAVVVASAVGASLLAATAPAVAAVFVLGRAGSGQVADLAGGLVAFAPGLLGFGLVAHLGRALYAADAGRAAAAATVTGWVVAVVADLGLLAVVPAERTVTALGAGNSVGMLVAGALLVSASRARLGAASVTGLAGGTVRAGAAAVVAAVAGLLLALALPTGSVWAALGTGVVVAAFTAVLVLGGLLLLDRTATRALLARLRGRSPNREALR